MVAAGPRIPNLMTSITFLAVELRYILNFLGRDIAKLVIVGISSAFWLDVFEPFLWIVVISFGP